MTTHIAAWRTAFGTLGVVAMIAMVLGTGCATATSPLSAISDADKAAMAQQQRVRDVFNKGADDHAEGDLVAAKKAYVQALAIDPKFVPALENLAAIDLAEGHAEKARSAFSKIVAAHPGAVTARLALAQWAVEQKRYQDAIALCRDALRVKPDSILGYQLAAESYMALGDLPRAELVVGRGLQWDANHSDLNRVAARLLTRRNHVLVATARLRTVLKNDGTRDDVRAQWIELALDVGDYGAASDELETLRKHRPDDVAVLLASGVAYKGLGQYDKAQSMYSAVLAKDPAHVDAMWNLAVLYQDQLAKYEEAMTLYPRVRSHASHDAAWMAQLALRIEDTTKRRDEARQLAAMQKAQEARQRALDAACTALRRKEPFDVATLGNANARVDAAWWLVSEAQSMATSGDVGKGKPLVECALKIIPYKQSSRSDVCASIHVVWGQVLHETGDVVEARRSIDAALVCDPAHEDAKKLAQQWQKSAQVTQ